MCYLSIQGTGGPFSWLSGERCPQHLLRVAVEAPCFWKGLPLWLRRSRNNTFSVLLLENRCNLGTNAQSLFPWEVAKQKIWVVWHSPELPILPSCKVLTFLFNAKKIWSMFLLMSGWKTAEHRGSAQRSSTCSELSCVMFSLMQTCLSHEHILEGSFSHVKALQPRSVGDDTVMYDMIMYDMLLPTLPGWRAPHARGLWGRKVWESLV